MCNATRLHVLPGSNLTPARLHPKTMLPINPACCSDEVAHLRSEQQAAREESLRLGAAAEKRAAIGECGCA